MSDYDLPSPEPDPILVVPSITPSTTTMLNRNQKILFGAIGLFVGMVIGAVVLSLFIRLMIWLVSSVVGQELAFTAVGLLLRVVGLIIGVVFGGLSGYAFGTADTAASVSRFNPFTPVRVLVARQAIWSLVAFCVGALPGGIVTSLFVTLFFLILNTSPGQELSDNPDWVRLRTVFVLIGMVIGGIAGTLVSIPHPREEQIALSETGIASPIGYTSKVLLRPTTEFVLTRQLLQSVRYFVFLITNTIRLLLPSPVVSTQRSDDTYISETSQTFKSFLDEKDEKGRFIIELDTRQRDIILKNWLPQIEWTNNRANRERDANELISWWQLIIAALIPFVASFESVGGIRGTLIVGILGIIVTVLTGLIQFRRPEERWRHYRILTEAYQRELWNFITLAGPYTNQRHKTAFKDFNNKMMTMREGDVRVFIGEGKYASAIKGLTLTGDTEKIGPSDQDSKTVTPSSAG